MAEWVGGWMGRWRAHKLTNLMLSVCISYLLLCNKLLQSYWLQTTTNIYYLTASGLLRHLQSSATWLGLEDTLPSSLMWLLAGGVSSLLHGPLHWSAHSGFPQDEESKRKNAQDGRQTFIMQSWKWPTITDQWKKTGQDTRNHYITETVNSEIIKSCKSCGQAQTVTN